MSNVTDIGHGRFLIDGDHRRVAYAAVDGSRTWVFISGITYLIETDAPIRRSATTRDAAALAAPMPATVTQVHVSPGQQVRAGDVLLTLEAMKMELPIRATADGTVTAIKCRPGELVQPGVPLVDVREREPGTEPEHEPGSTNGEA